MSDKETGDVPLILQFNHEGLEFLLSLANSKDFLIKMNQSRSSLVSRSELVHQSPFTGLFWSLKLSSVWVGMKELLCVSSTT